MNKNNFFSKYIIYNNIVKKGRKNYFLIDFFKGLKGSFLFKGLKKKYIKYSNLLYNSYNNFNSLSYKINYDYFFKNFNIYNISILKFLKKYKKKKYFFF